MDYPDNQQSHAVSIDGSAYADASSLQIRLDTDRLLIQIENFLRGKSYVQVKKFDEATKQHYIDYEEAQAGKRRANDEGVQGIMSYAYSLVNPHCAMGNIKQDQYEDIICDFREQLNDAMILNKEEWEISDQQYSAIQDHVCMLVRVFITRPINNLERAGFTRGMEQYGKEQYGMREQRRGMLSGLFRSEQKTMEMMSG